MVSARLAGPRFALIGCLLALTGLFALAWPFTVDDAFIAAHYARRLAGGLGYTFRPGPATDGVTGPLWLAPLVACARLGLDAATSAKCLGAAATLLSVWAVVRSARTRTA